MLYPRDSIRRKEKEEKSADCAGSDEDSIDNPAVMIPEDYDYEENKVNSVFDAASPRGLLDDDPTKRRWVEQKQATNFFISMLSCLYFLVLSIFALMVEISPNWLDEVWVAETVFFFFMYGTGIIFLVYCYIFMVYPQAYNYLIRLLHKYKIISNEQRWMIRTSNHMVEGAGTLYLRMGAMFFGCIGIVLFGFEIFLCIENYSCKSTLVAKHILAIIFTFVQMHFIFCNNKISILGSRKVAKFGMMHLVSVNLWTWFRFALAKQVYKANKKKKYENVVSSSSSSEEDLLSVGHGFLSEVVNQTISAVLSSASSNGTSVVTTTPKSLSPRFVSLEHFGDLATFLTTCIVEYSILGAAVMFIIWGAIDYEGSNQAGHVHVKRKQNMRVDCSNSSAGLFAGIVFLIASLVSMGMAYMFEELRNSKGAQLVFGIVDISLFGIALAACLAGLWRMRLLQYRLHAHGEVIDDILLVIGLIGEMIYCVIGIDMCIATIRHNVCCYSTIFPIFVFCTRLIQVITQTAFIFTTSRLRCLSDYAVKYQPGKQIITFLLIVNIALFAFHTFEATKTTFGIQESVSAAYMAIVYAVGPLLVFFRFHSSACLAEIWKHTYSTKHHSSHSSHGSHSQNLGSRTTLTTAEDLPSIHGMETV